VTGTSGNGEGRGGVRREGEEGGETTGRITMNSCPDDKRVRITRIAGELQEGSNRFTGAIRAPELGLCLERIWVTF